MSLYLGENKIADNTCSRNIGEIVASTIPLSDAGLHLLDGSLISNVGSYAKFVNYIAGLVTDYPDLFVSESDWQSSVSTYGVCGKFVYDSGNNTVRLPKITGFTEGTTDVTALGDLVEAGLPNITGTMSSDSMRMCLFGNVSSGALGNANGSTSSKYTGGFGPESAYNILDFDASRSSSIYGKSSTVQPQSIKVLYYIVIASSITNELNLDVADMATKSLDNLDSTGKNIANWSNNVTNCITEIPQDIKLELNDGTLTLKAGSKVYDGNGLITTTDVDILQLTASVNDTVFLIYIPSTNSLGTAYMTGESVSSLPTPTTSYKLYYNTTDRKCYIDNGTWLETSFPLAIATSTTTQFTSIDQVFNGFGYIGSTVFALPGVKGLIPNGRNADDSLKNIEWTANKVITQTLTFGAQSYYFGVFNNNQELAFYGKIVTKYDEKSNTIIDTYPDPDVIRIGWAFFGECIADSNNRITSFTPKTAFHALDYNDSSTISGWSMPSSRYIDLTLGASGSTYTAPANGWFGFVSATGGSNYYAILYNDNLNFASKSTSNNNGSVYTILPARKGDSVALYYVYQTLSSTTWRFYYAEGEN